MCWMREVDALRSEYIARESQTAVFTTRTTELLNAYGFERNVLGLYVQMVG